MITGDQGFLVIGLPVPQGDLTCSRGPTHKLYHQNKKTLEPWRSKVAAGARRWVTETADEGQPLEVALTWSLPRPKSHWGTGRNADRLKDSVPAYPTPQPDLDKLTRAVFDALKASGRIVDDAQITDAVVRKRYATTREAGWSGEAVANADDVLTCPGLVVRIYPIGADDA